MRERKIGLRMRAIARAVTANPGETAHALAGLIRAERRGTRTVYFPPVEVEK